MLFDLQVDDGNSIVAYVVPDSGGATPTISLRSAGVELMTLAANDQRQNLVEAGRHATGQCGFVINETIVPDLASYSDLEVTETSRNLLVYRRSPPGAVQAKIFRLETHLLPLWRFDNSVRRYFQYWYCGIDRYGRETSEQVFCLSSPSVFFSGRLLFKNFEFYLTKGVKMVGVIHDPYHELAERLLLLKTLGDKAEDLLGARDVITFAPVIGALLDCDLSDEMSCRRLFRRASDDVNFILSNPLVRQLTCVTPNELPTKSGVSSALDALASFEVLSLRSDPDSLASDLADLIGVEDTDLPTIEEYKKVQDLGEVLRTIPFTETLLEKDLEVFQVISNAFKAVES